jgi:hypothetical protein
LRPKEGSLRQSKSESQAVKLLCSGRGFTARAIELPLFDHVHGLNARDDGPRAPKRLEAEHWAGHPFDSPMVLLDDVVGRSRYAEQMCGKRSW